MNSRQIQLILKEGKFQHPFNERKLVETHISYVLLGTSFVYKFKKDIKYSFLDFSTLKNRKYFCEREVILNNRLSKGVYLDVVPVRQGTDVITIDGEEGKIIDYAVKMKRLKTSKQMNLMLSHHQVTIRHMKDLAATIRKFHEHTEIIHTRYHQDHFASRFNDLLSVSDFIKSALGHPTYIMIESAVRISNAFLKKHRGLFMERLESGNIRDCHGDLHARNIFLYARPVIFDCLEFNDELRQIDVLDEIAFFCMDLEAEGFYDLSNAFRDYYFSQAKKIFSHREHLLFTYYKCYRANVRAKVNALRAMKPDEPQQKKYLDEVNKYLILMQSYQVALQ